MEKARGENHKFFMLTLREKIKKAVHRPRLIKIRLYDDFIVGKLGLFQKKYNWRVVNDKIGQKVYKDYTEYVEHQVAKLATMDLGEYDHKYYSVLSERLGVLASKNVVEKGKTVLCLAARIGTEVRAFLQHGCFAVGIDLNPGKDNKYVVRGDFHNIQFPDKSVDVVFTNSLDHALYIKKVADEVKRVLKPNGFFILEVGLGFEEGGNFGYYEASAWQKVNDCLQPFLNIGFAVFQRDGFEFPWRGQQIILRAS